MTLQEEVARAVLPMFEQLAAAVHHEGPHSEAESAQDAAAALMPLIRKAQAEALRDAARLIRSLDSRDEPADRLEMYADAIEQEVEHDQQ